MKNIVIIGAGDFGKEVAWLIDGINGVVPTYNILGFLDDNANKEGATINGIKCLGPIRLLSRLTKTDDVCAVIAIQHGQVRKAIVESLPSFSRWETLIHPSANISNLAKIGAGCIICAGCNISVNVTISDQVLMNLSVTIGHDCSIGNYASMMSGVVVSGHVVLKEAAYLASNCTIVPGMKIGANAKVGAGSVVIRNVREGTTVMGVPAKLLRV